MTTYPTDRRSDFLAWCQAHAGVFVDQAAAVGLTVEQAAAFAGATEFAAAQLLAQGQAAQAAKTATEAAGAAFGALRSSAGRTVELIRAFARSAPQPGEVYQRAQLPAPAAPRPAPPPAQPENLRVALDPSGGQLSLSWKCRNPRGTSGTTYLVRRKLPGEADFAFLGVSGRKNFTDATLPAGSASVQYTIQAQRADLSGPLSPIFTVHFGKSGVGGVTAHVTTAAAPPGTSRFAAAPNGHGQRRAPACV